MSIHYEWSHEEICFDDFVKRVEDKQKEGWEVFSVQSDMCVSLGVLGSGPDGKRGFRVVFRRESHSDSFRWFNQDQDGMI